MRSFRLAICFATLLALFLLPSIGEAAPAAKPSRLAAVGTDGQIYVCSGGCAKPQCLTCPIGGFQARADGIVNVMLAAKDERAEYNWPTFSPDGTKLAYVGESGPESQPTFSVSVYNFAKHAAIDVFRSASERAIYLYWLPDGNHLSFLAAEPNGLSLMLAEARENAPLRIVMTGMPLYFDWQSHDRLVFHTANVRTGRRDRNEQVSLMSLSDANQQIDQVLARGAAPFKAPCWSPDRKHLAYIGSRGPREAALYIASPDGKNPRALVKLDPEESSFVWAPDSRHIAFSTAESESAPLFETQSQQVFNGIRLVDIQTGAVRKLCPDPVAAFYFSPDSRHLAYVSAPPEMPVYSWNVIDLGSGAKRRLASFLATSEQSIAMAYFDQLALSHRTWSPDSKRIVFGGVMVRGERPPPGIGSGPAPAPRVWVLPIDGSEPKSVLEGVLAFYSPS